MSRYYNEDTLTHFGIPGMKWGQHKAKQSGNPNNDRNIFGAYTGHKIKDNQRDDDEELPYID